MTFRLIASRMRRAPLAALAVVALAAGLTGCLAAPAVTTGITKVSTVTQAGYVWDYYRNTAYPCSASGYQTFVLGRKVGQPETTSAPLWVFMHGGGVGAFSPAGQPIPNANRMREELRPSLVGYGDNAGLMAKVRGGGYRIMAVSMCSHDLYAGMNSPDPYNPNTTPDGKKRPTTGLISTKSAIQFARDTYPTDDLFLHGGSAGSAGTIHTAWALQQQGIAPDGIVPDASVVNQAFEAAAAEQGVCSSPEEGSLENLLMIRVHPDLAKPENQPHELVERGALTVPIAHVWNKGDTSTCGETPMECPVGTTTVTLGATECQHRELTLAIEAQGLTSRSENFALCVEGKDTTTACDRHVVTTINAVSTLPGGVTDYNSAIWSWVQERRVDD